MNSAKDKDDRFAGEGSVDESALVFGWRWRCSYRCDVVVVDGATADFC